MSKSFWLKLCVVVMAMSMVLSLAACVDERPDPEGTTAGTTEQTTEPNTTESEGADTTETETDTETETETDSDAETADPNACQHELGEWQSNGSRHWKECSKCQESFEAGDHTVGTEYKTDETHHWRECTVCARAVEKAEHLGTVVNNGDTHSKTCTECNVEYEKGAHTFEFSKSRELHECECGATEECPAKSAECKYDDDQHWYTIGCEICEIFTEKAAHRWESDATTNSRTCVLCGLVVQCDGDHFTADKNGHKSTKDCDICGVKKNESGAHNFIDLDPTKGSKICSTCDWTCTENHYTKDEDSHSIAADCNICGTKVLEDTPHDTFAVWATVGEELTTYHYGCKTCGYEAKDSWTISNDVNYYSAPGQAVSHYNTIPELKADGDFLYTRVTFKVSGSVKLRNNYDGANTMANADGVITDGPGVYAIMKIRIGSKRLGDVKIGLYDGDQEIPIPPATNGVDTDKLFDIGSHTRPITDAMVGEWIIYVVDLSTLTRTNGDNFWYDLENGDMSRISVGFKIRNGAGADASKGQTPEETDYIDVAYFAIVDDFTEIASIVQDDAEKVTFATVWSDSSKDEERYLDGKCVGECVSGVVEENKVTSDTVCYTCDKVTYECLNPYCENFMNELSRETGVSVDHVTATRNVNEQSKNGTDANVCYTYDVETYCKVCGEVTNTEAKTVGHIHVVTETNLESKNGTDASVCYVYDKVTTCSECSWTKTDADQNAGHTLGAPTLAQDGSKYTYTCGHGDCGLAPEVAVATGVNYLSVPGQIVNNWGTADQYATGGSCGLTNSHYNRKELLTDVVSDENGVYTRIHVFKGASFYIANGTVAVGENGQTTHTESAIVDSLNSGKGGLGRFIVMRFRNVDNAKIRFGFKTDTGKEIKWDGNGWRDNEVANSAPDLLSGEFTTYVVDISGYVDANATKIRILMGVDATDMPAGARIDFAYLAIVDNWDEVQAVVGEGSDVFYTTNFHDETVGATIKANDDHTGMAHSYSTVSDETSYSIKCALCDAVKETKTIDGSINYFSAPGQIVGAYNTTAQLITDDGDFAYTRINFGLSGSAKIHNVASTAKNLAVADDSIKGAGRYAVIKLRVDDKAAIGQLKLGLYNGDEVIPSYVQTVYETYTDTELEAFTKGSDNCYYDGETKVADASKRKLDSNGQLIVASYNKWSGNNSDLIFGAVRGQANLVDDTWMVYVIDLSKLTFASTYYQNDNQPTQNEDGSWNLNQKLYTWYDVMDSDMDNISVGLQIQAGKCSTAASAVDIAYFAIVDDWTEIKSVAGANTSVTYTTWSSSTNDKSLNTDNPCSAGHSGMQVNDGTKYSFVCDICGASLTDVTYNVQVGAGEGQLNALSLPGFWNFTSTWHSKLNTALAIGDDGIPYAQFTQTSGQGGAASAINASYSGRYNASIVSMFTSTGNAYGSGHGSVAGGSGNFLVFKIKTTGIVGLQLILNANGTGSASADQCSTTYNQSWTNFDDGEWHVIVVDLNAYKTAYNRTSLVLGDTVTTFAADLVTYYAQTENEVDIAYAALCDNWAEVKSLVGTDKMVYTNWNDLQTAPTYDFTDTTVECSHTTYAISGTDGNVTTYVCSGAASDVRWDDTTKTFVGCTNTKTVTGPSVGADGINFYSAAGYQKADYRTTKGDLYWQETEDGGFMYQTMNLQSSGNFTFHAAGGTQGNILSKNNTVYGSGKYIVLKVKVSANINQLKVGIYDGTVTTTNGDDPFEANILAGSTNLPTDWTVYVIDIAEMTAAYGTRADYYTENTTDTVQASFGLKIANNSDAALYAGDINVAYFAVCDSWAEIDSIVGNDSVFFTDADGSVITDATLDSAAIDAKVQEEAQAAQ